MCYRYIRIRYYYLYYFKYSHFNPKLYQQCVKSFEFFFCRYPNVLILTTSNVTEAIDLAFVDRADIKQYIGPPSPPAIFKIFHSCVKELMRGRMAYSQTITQKNIIAKSLLDFWRSFKCFYVPTRSGQLPV